MSYNQYILNMDETYDILKDKISPAFVEDIHNTLKNRIKFNSILDIGAYNGKDGEYLASLFGVPIENTLFIEAHPDMANILRSKYPNVIECAVSNSAGVAEFNAVDLAIKQNHGVSSLRNRNDTRIYKKVLVMKRTMEDILKEFVVNPPYLVKIDTEGCSYETLLGFGEKLHDVCAIHVECEHKQIWQDQKIYDEVAEFLKEKGFTLISFKRTENQSDSIWISYPQEK